MAKTSRLPSDSGVPIELGLPRRFIHVAGYVPKLAAAEEQAKSRRIVRRRNVRIGPLKHVFTKL